VTLLSPETVRRVVASHEGTCMSAQAIDDLRGEIYARYDAAGYALVQLYVAAQDMSQGQLTLAGAEGPLDHYAINKNGEPRKGLNNAFLARPGDPFKLRRYEQGLDILGALRTYRRPSREDLSITGSATNAAPGG